MRCSEPGHRAPAAIAAPRGPGRWALIDRQQTTPLPLLIWLSRSSGKNIVVVAQAVGHKAKALEPRNLDFFFLLA